MSDSPKVTTIHRVKLDLIVVGDDPLTTIGKAKIPGMRGMLGMETTLIRDSDGWVNPAWKVEEEDGTMVVTNKAMARNEAKRRKCFAPPPGAAP